MKMLSTRPPGGLHVSNKICINAYDLPFAPLHGSLDSFFDMASSVTTLYLTHLLHVT
jgi:hypothetical protein